jgi:hypothetical protein
MITHADIKAEITGHRTELDGCFARQEPPINKELAMVDGLRATIHMAAISIVTAILYVGQTFDPRVD